MNAPKIAALVVIIWILATVWSNLLDTTATAVLASADIETLEAMGSGNVLTAQNLPDAFGFVGNIFKALTFDYCFFSGYLIFVRYICWCLTVGFVIALIYIVATIWQAIKP